MVTNPQLTSYHSIIIEPFDHVIFEEFVVLDTFAKSYQDLESILGTLFLHSLNIAFFDC